MRKAMWPSIVFLYVSCISLFAVFVLSLVPCEAAQQGMELVWSDEFNGNSLDMSKWSYEEGFIRNEELQYFTKDNVSVRGGYLTIEARKETVKNKDYDLDWDDHFTRWWIYEREYAHYTSGSIKTGGLGVPLKAAFGYGRIDMRAKVPEGSGVWTAIWLLAQGGGMNPSFPLEIDIAEYSGKRDKVFGVVHYRHDGDRYHKKKWYKEDGGLYEKFHVFSLDWSPGLLRYYVDGNLFHWHKVEHADPMRDYMMLLSFALGFFGGEIDDSIFPQKFVVDYIRYYKKTGVKRNIFPNVIAPLLILRGQ